MKKLVILSSLLLIAALAGAGALGVFTDKAEVDGTITAGTLTLGTGGTQMNLSGMAPGDTRTGCLVVKNNGSLDMLFRVQFKNVLDKLPNHTLETQHFADQLDVVVTLNPTSGECSVPSGYLAYGAEDNQLFPEEGFDPISLTELLNTDIDNVSAWYETGWPLKKGYAATYQIDVTLPFTSGNEYQEASFTADIVIDAVQAANQDPDNVLWDNFDFTE